MAGSFPETQSQHRHCPRPNADALDKIIPSKRFWAMIRIICETALQAEHFGRWSEGCSCHESLILEWTRQQVGWSGCQGSCPGVIHNLLVTGLCQATQ